MDPSKPQEPTRSKPASVDQATLDRVRSALEDLRYGTVTIVVQDGVVVQIERTEKLRLR